MIERSWWLRTALVVGVLSAVVYLADAFGRFWGFLGDLLLIFFFAWLVGSVLIHVVNSLMRIPHMRRPLAILLVYIGLITLIADFAFLVIPATVTQVRELAADIPNIVAGIPGAIDSADEILGGIGINAGLADRIQIQPINDIAASITDWLTVNAGTILTGAASALFSVTLVIAISFYIVLDGGRRLREGLKVLPPRVERETWFVLTTIDDTFHGYVRGMLVVSAIYGVGTASVMLATGLPAALPTALISSVLLAVPFIGDWLALALPLLIAIVAGDFITFIIVLAVLLFVQQVMLNLLTPRILGHAVRMPAMLVIISVVLGARLAGIPGALLGVPTAGVVYGLGVHYGTRIRQRREARESMEREERGAIEREGFAEEVERARQGQAPDITPPAA
ncbi:MAG: AI-2E family transporter [Chloroflexi bacterium]|nr:AI-2E family transporter [Chloroflexota bacterium]